MRSPSCPCLSRISTASGSCQPTWIQDWTATVMPKVGCGHTYVCVHVNVHIPSICKNAQKMLESCHPQNYDLSKYSHVRCLWIFVIKYSWAWLGLPCEMWNQLEPLGCIVPFLSDVFLCFCSVVYSWLHPHLWVRCLPSRDDGVCVCELLVIFVKHC